MRARSPRSARAALTTAVLSTAVLSTAVLTCGVAALVSAGPASAAAPAPAPASPIGGPQLGPGLAVNLTPTVKALPTTTTAKSWLVADLDTGNVLAAYNAHVPHQPASTLKTLAALALIPRVGPAVRVPFTADELALASQKDGVSTRVGLQVGQTYPAKRLFEAMLSLSANDAAEALSAAAPGGRAAVLADMNGIAASLQARETHAGTPDGLPAAGQLESAYDEALIVRAALQLPTFSAYDTVPKVTIPAKHPFSGYNHDRLQNSYPNVIGGKDGYTVASGQVWWGASSRYGHRLVVVVMDAGYGPVTQEINLLNWGFSADGKIAPVGTLVGPVTSSGQPATVAQVASGLTPGSVASTAKPKASGTTGKGTSGPWSWVLGALVLLAALLLGRRHLRAAGWPAIRWPALGRTSTARTSTARTSTAAPAMSMPAVEAMPASPPAPPSTVAPSVPAAAVTPAPASDWPDAMPTAARNTRIITSLTGPTTLTASSASTAPQPSAAMSAPELTQPLPTPERKPAALEPAARPEPPRRVTAWELRPEDVAMGSIEELPTTGPATSPEVLEAQHDRLRTGAVRVVPAPPRPGR